MSRESQRAYRFEQASEDRSVPRDAVSYPRCGRLTGVDGSVMGELRPFPGFKKVYELDFYGDANHDARSEVTDFWPVTFRRGSRSFAYGFVYRAKRATDATQSDVFLDFYDVRLGEWDTGNLLASGVDPESPMDVRVQGRLAFVFFRGRSPVRFYIRDREGDEILSTSDSALVLEVAGVDGLPPLPGPGLQARLLGPGASRGLGSLVGTGDPARPGFGQIVLDERGPQDLGLLKELEEDYNAFVGVEILDGFPKLPKVVWKTEQYEVQYESGSETQVIAAVGGVPVQADDLVLVHATFSCKPGVDRSAVLEVWAEGDDEYGLDSSSEDVFTGVSGTEQSWTWSGSGGPDAGSSNMQSQWFWMIATGAGSLEVRAKASNPSGFVQNYNVGAAVFVVRGVDTADPVRGGSDKGVVTGQDLDLVHTGEATLFESNSLALTGYVWHMPTGAETRRVSVDGAEKENRVVRVEADSMESGLYADGMAVVSTRYTYDPGDTVTPAHTAFERELAVVPGAAWEEGYTRRAWLRSDVAVNSADRLATSSTSTASVSTSTASGVYGGPEVVRKLSVSVTNTSSVLTFVNVELKKGQAVWVMGGLGVDTLLTSGIPEMRALVGTSPMTRVSNRTIEEMRLSVFRYVASEDETVPVLVENLGGTTGQQFFGGFLYVLDSVNGENLLAVPLVETVKKDSQSATKLVTTAGTGDQLLLSGFIANQSRKVSNVNQRLAVAQTKADFRMGDDFVEVIGGQTVETGVYLAAGESSDPTSSSGFEESGEIDWLMLTAVFRGGKSADAEDFEEGFVLSPLSPADGATNQSVDVELRWTGAYGDGRPDPTDLVYDVWFGVRESVPLQKVATVTTESYKPGQLFSEGRLNYGQSFLWKVVARRSGLDGSGLETPVQTFETAGEFEANQLEPGDYSFGYLLEDSETGLRSSFSEVAAARTRDFPEDGEDRDEAYAYLEVVYDSDKYDRLWLYRSVRTQDAGGKFVAAIKQLDRIVDLETFQTVNNGEGERFEPDQRFRQAVIPYKLLDGQLVNQEPWLGLTQYDSELPHGGTAMIHQQVLVVSDIEGGERSTPEENRAGDAKGGLGEVRWSDVFELSVELFPPLNRYVPAVPNNGPVKLMSVGGNGMGFSRDRMFVMSLVNGRMRIREMHEGMTGLVSPEGAEQAGSLVFLVTEKGMKRVDPYGQLDDVDAFDRLIKREWKETLESVSLGYDPYMGCLFVLNADLEQMQILWFETAKMTSLKHTNFTQVKRGNWVRDLTDPDGVLTERALFLQNSPDLTTQIAEWKPKVFVVDFERTRLIDGSNGDDGAKRLTLLDIGGDSMFTVVASTGTQVTPEVSSGQVGEQGQVVGAKLYVVSGESKGQVRTIVDVPQGSALEVDSALTLAKGDVVAVSPILFEVEMPSFSVGGSGDQDIAGQYLRRRILQSVRAVFEDVANSKTVYGGVYGATYEGLVWKANRDTVASEEFATDENRQVAEAVADAMVKYEAVLRSGDGIGETEGVDGVSLVPGLRVVVADLDFRLVSVLVTGTMEDTVVQEIGDGKPA